MDFFLQTALASPPGGGQTGGFLGLLPILLIFVVFYFLLIRPQTKRAKEHRAMVAALNAGDEVVTNGGVLGRITEVGDQFVTLEIAEGIQVKVQRHMIGALVPKGTVKST